MYKSSGNLRQASLFWDLESVLDSKHPLYKLANLVDWNLFERTFTPLYCPNNGRTAKPIRLMVGLIEDKRKEDEDKKNHKDNRGRKSDSEQTAFIDSTVQEKNVTIPTDSKLLNKVIKFCRKVAEIERLKVRQSYAREIKDLKLIQRFRGKKNSVAKVKKADRRMRTIAGRLLRELQRLLPVQNDYQEQIDVCMKFVNGEKIDGHKIYSIHEPDVQCISKGKDYKKYEFGNKASIIRLWNGLIIGAMSFRNEYDGHTIDKAMNQVRRIYGRPIKFIAGDRGYRGQDRCGDAKVLIPSVPKKSDSLYVRTKKHELFRKRAGIEPAIGHCKSDHRLSRNFYKGLVGDSINVMLAAAAFNFKRVMRTLLCLIERLAIIRIWDQMRLNKQSLCPAISPCAYACERKEAL